MSAEREKELLLDCCQTAFKARFAHKDAPWLPLHRFRTNVECPSCGKIVILTLTEWPERESQIDQEVINEAREKERSEK